MVTVTGEDQLEEQCADGEVNGSDDAKGDDAPSPTAVVDAPVVAITDKYQPEEQHSDGEVKERSDEKAGEVPYPVEKEVVDEDEDEIGDEFPALIGEEYPPTGLPQLGGSPSLEDEPLGNPKGEASLTHPPRLGDGRVSHVIDEEEEGGRKFQDLLCPSKGVRAEQFDGTHLMDDSVMPTDIEQT